MTYIDLINRFWELDSAYAFSSFEVHLYFILLDYANRSGWREPLNLPNSRFFVRMQCSEPTFIQARQRLNDLGVFRYEKGTTRKAGKYFYSQDYLTTFSNHIPNPLPIVSQSLSNPFPISGPYIRQRLEKEKTRLDQKQELKFLYVSPQKTEVTRNEISNGKIEKSEIPKNSNSQKSDTDIPFAPFAEIIKLYHETCKSYPAVQSLTEKRKQHLRARWVENKAQIGTFKKAFENMEKSSFLKGDNQRGWHADFDWLIKSQDNFLKVLEGKYIVMTPPGLKLDPRGKPSPDIDVSILLQ